MSHERLQQFTKRPDEERDVTIDFGPALASGVTVTGFVANYPKASLLSDDSDQTSAIIDSSSFSSPDATARVKNGSDGSSYRLVFRVNFSNSEIVEHNVIMEVKDA